MIRGKRRDIGLGSVDRVSLAQARRTAFEYRNIARAGGDPTIRSEVRTVPTFAEAIDAVIDIQRPGWKDSGKSEKQWRASFRDYAIKLLGRMRVNEITTADVLAVLVPIWHTKHETARRVRQRIGQIMKWAIAEGHRSDNPAGDALGAALPKNSKSKEHHKALPYDRVSAALATVRASGAYVATRLAFEFLVLTAARSGEVRGAKWNEISFDARMWTVPPARMKTMREHRVPLSARALGILRTAREYSDSSGLIFPSVTGRGMSDSTMSKLLRENGIEAVPHGFRSSFRDWASERTNIPREVAEESLAHENPNKVESAYRRSDLFERRRDLMDSWARYLAAERASVVEIRR